MNIRIPIDPDSFEDWVERFRDDNPVRFEERLNASTIGPALSVFRPTGDERAPVPIAGLIDTQDLRRFGIVRGVFDRPDVGIAEFVNPNYLSNDTIFKDFALPRQSQFGMPFFELEDQKFRRYWPKVAGGAVEVSHFVAEGALYQSLFDMMPEPPGVAWVLDDRVNEAYATDLLPRAVGYSTALIDYFFRGRLDVDVVDNAAAGEPSQIRLVGRNASDEPLVNGGLRLFADDATGTRTRLEPVSGSIDDAIVRDIGPGADLVSTWFQASQGAERFVAVYQGALGDEPEAPYPGAVIGKVLGGVRVEHVFADGEYWKIRTPAGMFTLPLTTAEFQEVKWGSGPDVLVARTWFGEGLPNRFASFAVQRRPGSIDIVTDPTSGLVMIGDLAAAEFPFGVALTTVAFNQTVRYRQRLARIEPLVLHWRQIEGSLYGIVRIDAGPPAIEEVRRKDFTFSNTFAVILDQGHNLQFASLGAERYLWDVFSVTADADGRLFAIINVQLFAPAGTQSTDFLGVNHVTGELEKQSTAYIDAIMPVDVGPIWAVLDLETSRIVASTVGDTIAITSEVRAEAPPFASPSYVRLDRFDPMYTAGVWFHVTNVYEDGPSGGVVADGLWSVRAPVEFRAGMGTFNVRGVVESSVGVETVVASGLRREDLATAAPISTEVTAVRSVRDVFYLQSHAGVLDGLRIETSDGAMAAPTQFFDVRPVSSVGPPRLAFLALDSDAAGGATHVIAWDHEAGRAAVVATLPQGSHGLSGATASTALVNSYLGPDFEPAGFIVRLDETRPPLAFLGENMWSFTLLEPSYLYNAEAMRFYRLNAPLQRTALPASLAGGGDTSGDFHAVRLP